MRIEEQITIAASREEVWEVLGDPVGYPRFMPGITRFEAEARAHRENDDEGESDPGQVLRKGSR
nr:SRPBCC family protein [Thermoleophilaceae bacterium]